MRPLALVFAVTLVAACASERPVRTEVAVTPTTPAPLPTPSVPPPSATTPADAGVASDPARMAEPIADVDGDGEAHGLGGFVGRLDDGGVGRIGTGGAGATGQGFGSGHGRLGGQTRQGRARVRQGPVTVTGRLPPEVVQRIVRQNFGRFKLCYEDGLRRAPALRGTVAVHFVIAPDGSVSTSEAARATDLPDRAAVACVVRGFGNISFPRPERGKVDVIFHVAFAPGS